MHLLMVNGFELKLEPLLLYELAYTDIMNMIFQGAFKLHANHV